MPFLRPFLRRLTALGLSLGLALANLHAAATDEARSELAVGIEEVANALRTPSSEENIITRLGPLVGKHFAFATTTRLAVGPAWRNFTPAQRDRAVDLLGNLIIRTYADRYNGDTHPEVTYGTPLELRAGRIEIPTKLRTLGQTYSVTYRMELDTTTTPSRWRIYDIVAEGVSLISNYRSQFDPIVSQSGAEGLIKTIETKLTDPAAR
jgi:phospholipid transport system substrate-binding protein